MIQFKKILCPIDFSNFTENLISVALKMADKDTTIYCFHALTIPYSIDPNGLSMNMMIENELEESTKKNILELKSNYLEKYPNQQFDFSYSLSSDSSSTICEKAEEIKADLIIMGTHGRSGLNRLLMGSVAESVLRDAKCPVFMLKIKK